MIDSIQLTNITNGQSVTMNRSDADYLIDDDGLDWGTISSSFSTISNLDGYGSTLNATDTSEPREIHIIGWVVGTEAEMASKKNQLSKVIVPQNAVRINVSEYYIKAEVSKTLSFGTTIQTNNEKMCRFEIILSALYPFFEKIKHYSGLSDGDTILNLGDRPVGLIAILTLNQSVENPHFYIEMEDERVSVFEALGTYPSGTQIKVNTQYASKQVTLDGRKNFNVMSMNYGWIQVPVSYTNNDFGTVHISSGVEVDLTFNEVYSILGDL